MGMIRMPISKMCWHGCRRSGRERLAGCGRSP